MRDYSRKELIVKKKLLFMVCAVQSTVYQTAIASELLHTLAGAVVSVVTDPLTLSVAGSWWGE